MFPHIRQHKEDGERLSGSPRRKNAALALLSDDLQDRENQIQAIQYENVALQAQLEKCQDQIHDLVINRHVPRANDPGKDNIATIIERTYSQGEHIAKVNMPNIVYPNQHIDTEIPHGSRYYVIVPDTIKITFNLDTESTDKTRSIANNVGRVLVKKKVLMLGSKDIDTINNSDVYHSTRIFTRAKKNVKRSGFKAYCQLMV